MNSNKTIIIVLVILLVCSSFIIGYLINKNVYIVAKNNEPVKNEIDQNVLNVLHLFKNAADTNTREGVGIEEIQPSTTVETSQYEVKKGDTLDTISRLFGVSKETIIKANNLKTETISAGDILNIPNY